MYIYYITYIYIGLLFRIRNASNHTKCVSLNNHYYMTEPALINFYPIQYNQQLSYYPYSVNLDRCVGHCNSFSDLSNRTYIRKKTEDLSLLF